MFTPTTRSITDETSSRQTPAVFARQASKHEAQEMPRAEAMMPRTPTAPSPEEWTRECLFDCYND